VRSDPFQKKSGDKKKKVAEALVNILIVFTRSSFYFFERPAEKILENYFSQYVQDEPCDTA